MRDVKSQLMRSADLVAHIKEHQRAAATALIANSITPRLAILVTIDSPVTNAYLKMKQAYGAALGVAVDVHNITVDQAPALIAKLNASKAVHAIILQLPLQDPSRTEEIVNLVDPKKDVDGLGAQAAFVPATPMAILWLIASYRVDLHDKKVVLIGRGKLVGAPLEKLMHQENIDVTVATRSTVADIPALTRTADVVITATGSPGAVTADMVKPGAVVVDAGVASEGNKTIGDLDEDVYQRDDLLVTPTKGGVGPLTVCALFENTLTAAGGTPTNSATVFYTEVTE